MSDGLFMWRADCSFPDVIDGQTFEKCHTIYYTTTTADPKDAAAEAVAWVENRQRNLPEWFLELLALKVYAFHPKAIGEDGRLEPCTSFFAYEWKCDTGKEMPRRRDAS